MRLWPRVGTWTRRLSRRVAVAAMVGAVLAGMASPAAADEPGTAGAESSALVQQASAAGVSDPGRIRLFLVVDANMMMASKTFDAVFQKSTVTALGGGVEVLDVVRRVFVRAALTSTHVGGQRAELFDGVVVRLGVPLRLGLRTLEVGGGWRFRPLARGRVVPYAGGSVLRVTYDETSSFAEADDNLRESFPGAAALVGIEVRVAPWIVVGLEAAVRTVPNALGDGGLSREFRERDLGSRTIRFRLGIAR